MMPQALRLVLLRHGQSEWNAAGIFTGWENASLTATGEEEATRAGMLLATHGLLPAFTHTSLQHRTIRTAELALAAADRDWIPVRRSWRLNGRHYGTLQGRRKTQVRREYGEGQFTAWHRSYDATPPPLGPDAARLQHDDPRYAMLPPDAQPACPGSKSLGRTCARTSWAPSTSTRMRPGTRSRRSGTRTRPRPERGSHERGCVHHAPCPVVIMRGKHQ